jgi:hypothetical protein
MVLVMYFVPYCCKVHVVDGLLTSSYTVVTVLLPWAMVVYYGVDLCWNIYWDVLDYNMYDIHIYNCICCGSHGHVVCCHTGFVRGVASDGMVPILGTVLLLLIYDCVCVDAIDRSALTCFCFCCFLAMYAMR